MLLNIPMTVGRGGGIHIIQSSSVAIFPLNDHDRSFSIYAELFCNQLAKSWSFIPDAENDLTEPLLNQLNKYDHLKSMFFVKESKRGMLQRFKIIQNISPAWTFFRLIQFRYSLRLVRIQAITSWISR